ncbi:MAG: DUF4097 family beta strand repeat-containing protein [Gemmatimonadota bacterium]
MSAVLTAGLLGVALLVSGPADTVLRVERGEHVLLSDVGGVVHVDGTEGRELEVVVDGGRPTGGSVRVSRSGNEIRIRGAARGHSADVPRDYRVRVPRWMTLRITGNEAEVEVRGLRSEAEIRVQEGDVRVHDHDGDLTVRALDGGVWIEDVRGRIQVDAPDNEIRVRRAVGDFVLNSVDGDIDLRDVRAGSVEVATIDGDIGFEGTLEPGGRSALTTHDGDIALALERDASVDVRALARDGSFSSTFPVEVRRMRGGTEVEFRLGAGEASLRVETFDGDVRVRLRGESDREGRDRGDRTNHSQRLSRGGGR